MTATRGRAGSIGRSIIQTQAVPESRRDGVGKQIVDLSIERAGFVEAGIVAP